MAGNIVDIIKYTSGIVNSISGSGTTNELAYFTASTTISSLTTATYPSLTELSYVKGVTSSIQTQLNGKQNTLTNPVTGTGTTNYLPKFTGTSTIGNSQVIDNGTQVGVGLTPNASYGTFQIKAPAGVYTLDLVGRTAGVNSESQITFWNAAQSSALGYIYNTGSNLYIGTGANQPFTLSSGGNFIFGSTSDNGARLQVSGAARVDSEYAYYWQRTSGGSNIWSWSANSSSSYLYNHTTATPVLTFLNNGNVGIGTTTPDVTGFGWRTLTIKGGTASGEAGVIELQSPATTGAANLGIIAFMDGSNRNAQIYSQRASSTTTGNILFATNGGTGLLERMQITSGGDQINYGNIFLNQTAVGIVNANATSIGINGIYNMSRGSGAGLTHIQFGNGGNIVGSVSSSTVLTSYNTTSDYRLKEDLQEIKGLEKVQAIKVYDYKWKSEDSRMDGVLAHELAEVLPYAVTGEKDAVDEEGKDKMQSVDYSKIVPILIKAVQELQAKLDKNNIN
jgi:hypothetical protein